MFICSSPFTFEASKLRVHANVYICTQLYVTVPSPNVNQSSLLSFDYYLIEKTIIDSLYRSVRPYIQLYVHMYAY